MNTVTSSRRNVMRALAALSTGLPTLAYATPVFATTPSVSDAFPKAVAEYRYARSEFERIAEIGDDDASEVAGNVSDAAFEAVLKAPARDGGDLATKLEILLFEYTDCILDEDRLRLIVADARRLGERELV